MKIQKFILAIAAFIAVLPGISQLLKINMLPDLWQNGKETIGIAASILLFMLVMILYGYRNTISKMSKKRIVLRGVGSFLLFLVSLVIFNVLISYCVYTDPSMENTENQSNKVFIPIFLPTPLQEKVSNPQIGSRSSWVEYDGKYNVIKQLEDHKAGSQLHLSMIVFLILYLSLFVFSIFGLLLLGFHFAPSMENAE